MQIEKCEKQIKCDIYGCPNMANYTFKTGKLLNSKTYFCNECLNGLYQAIGCQIVPKSPKTPFKERKKK